ncbi:MAG: succinate dehydrogenase, cytochrome b556 subunit [Paraglaciecola sp.]|uniref:succinate dehydrogenase, cytochrome b556 subunit n=1 Tax=Paraglaciecola sp. TaxID=1920173 RepID=UPI003267F496
MKKQRPVNLQLNTISFPPAAITSILHRITGVALFFALMFVIWAWAVSVSSSEGFSFVQEQMSGPLGLFVSIGTISALLFHVLGGVRHMIMDLGHWEELQSGDLSAKIIIAAWIILTVVIGVVLW